MGGKQVPGLMRHLPQLSTNLLATCAPPAFHRNHNNNHTTTTYPDTSRQYPCNYTSMISRLAFQCTHPSFLSPGKATLTTCIFEIIKCESPTQQHTFYHNHSIGYHSQLQTPTRLVYDSVNCIRFPHSLRSTIRSVPTPCNIIRDIYGYPMQTISCTWRRAYFLPTHLGTPPFGPGEEKPAAFGPGEKRRPAMPSAPPPPFVVR